MNNPLPLLASEMPLTSTIKSASIPRPVFQVPVITPQIEEVHMPKTLFPKSRAVEAIEIIKQEVAAVYGVDVRFFRNKKRGKKFVADPRMRAMSICYWWGLGSTAVIGWLFNRDHTSVTHAVKETTAVLNQSDVERTRYLRCLDNITRRWLAHVRVPTS